MIGNFGNDIIDGGDGDDIIDGGGNVVFEEGGNDVDIIFVGGGNNIVIVFLGDDIIDVMGSINMMFDYIGVFIGFDLDIVIVDGIGMVCKGVSGILDIFGIDCLLEIDSLDFDMVFLLF